jgi:metal-responsive CopG/Arc/MetJ family transcriptional regulator
MQEQITVDIPGEIKTALDDAVRSEGISCSELVGKALKQYLFSRRFRLLSDRLTAKAQAQGIRNEEDVFGRVS